MDPTWSESQAGSPFVHGDYLQIGEQDGRPIWERIGEEELRPKLFFTTSSRRWWIAPYPESPGTATWYFTDTNEWDLPDVVWNKAGSGELPVPLLVPWDAPPLPTAMNLLCAGKHEPINMLHPNPVLSWTFVAAEGGPPGQTAYQVQVATTGPLLNAHTPDLWDSGVIEASLEGAIYVGEPLPSEELHWWAVRVRDADGLWSEDWG